MIFGRKKKKLNFRGKSKQAKAEKSPASSLFFYLMNIAYLMETDPLANVPILPLLSFT